MLAALVAGCILLLPLAVALDVLRWLSVSQKFLRIFSSALTLDMVDEVDEVDDGGPDVDAAVMVALLLIVTPTLPQRFRVNCDVSFMAPGLSAQVLRPQEVSLEVENKDILS